MSATEHYDGQSIEDWHITFERVGRNHNVPDFDRQGVDMDDERSVELACHALDRHIGKHLGSRFFGWHIDDETGVLSIEAGRFGRGQATFTPTTQEVSS